MSAWQTFDVTLNPSGVHFTRKRFTTYHALITHLGQEAAQPRHPRIQALPPDHHPLAWTGLNPDHATLLWSDGHQQAGVTIPPGAHLPHLHAGWLTTLAALQPTPDDHHHPLPLRQAWLSEILARQLQQRPPHWQLSTLIPGGTLLHAEEYPLIKLSTDHHQLVHPAPHAPPTSTQLHWATFALTQSGHPLSSLRLPRAALNRERPGHPSDPGAQLRALLATLLQHQAAPTTPREIAAQLAWHLGGELTTASRWEELITLEECTLSPPTQQDRAS